MKEEDKVVIAKGAFKGKAALVLRNRKASSLVEIQAEMRSVFVDDADHLSRQRSLVLLRSKANAIVKDHHDKPKVRLRSLSKSKRRRRSSIQKQLDWQNQQLKDKALAAPPPVAVAQATTADLSTLAALQPLLLLAAQLTNRNTHFNDQRRHDHRYTPYPTLRSPPPDRQSFFSGICYNCGKQGHRSRECRSAGHPKNAQRRASFAPNARQAQ